MTIYEQMLSKYGSNSMISERNAAYEVMQQITLAGLYKGGFFKEAAFYGGTCLRIFHGLQRFSEDMDFSLLRHDENFNFEKYFPAIIQQFEIAGRNVEITKKNKQSFGKVESAFLKDNTDVYDVTFQTEKSMKIKIEVDINPPMGFRTEQKLLLQPTSFLTQCYRPEDLFAGKMHALVYRGWKNRVKGRDWYDFAWYVKNNIRLNFEHLRERIRDFNGEDITLDDFKKKLEDKLMSTDIDLVKADVRNFLIDKDELEIWSNDYFLQLAGMMKIEGAITNVTVYPNNTDSKYFIRCSIDDNQQSAQVLNSDDAKIWAELKETGNINAMENFKQTMAEKYYKSEIDMTNNRSKGMGR